MDLTKCSMCGNHVCEECAKVSKLRAAMNAKQLFQEDEYDKFNGLYSGGLTFCLMSENKWCDFSAGHYSIWSV